MHIPRIVLILVFAVSTDSLFAQQQNKSVAAQEILRCAAKQNSIERLSCFDELAKTLGPPTRTEAIQSVGKWESEQNTSRFDDTRSVTLRLSANEQIRGWPQKAHTPSLIIRCREKRTQAYIDFGMSPNVESGVHNGATLTFRIDKQPAFKLVGSKSTDGEALFLPDAIAFAKRLMKANQLLVRFVPFNSSPTETTFDVAGLDRAIASLQRACNWPAQTDDPAGSPKLPAKQ